MATKAKADKHSWSIVGWVQRVTFSNLEIILEGCCYSFTVLRLTKTLKHQDFFFELLQLLDFQETKWKVKKMPEGENPKFYAAMKNQQRGMNRSKVTDLAPTWQAPIFCQFHILGSGMAIHAPWTIITQHFSWNRVDYGCFFFIGVDIFLSDNLNPDQFLLTQTFGCIAVISGWVGHLLTSISARF